MIRIAIDVDPVLDSLIWLFEWEMCAVDLVTPSGILPSRAGPTGLFQTKKNGMVTTSQNDT